ncbi:hypothetical protein [Chryseobacterium sp. SIMBA_029]|uniref:hypothetical protein n=1 Tax=Chryseobacterium sp. SIMBA_029 TaxID=3085772 RepID=UPI003978887F
MQGGNNFEQSFVAGALGSLASSAFTGIVGSTGVGNILFSALSGGVGSKLTGGNFWEGAGIGGIVAGLNHELHTLRSSLVMRDVINRIDEEINKAYGNEEASNAKPEVTAQAAAKLILKIPELSRLLNEIIKSGGSVNLYALKNYEIHAIDEKGNKFKAKAMTTFRGKTGLIKLARIAYFNNRSLALTLGHELMHVFSQVSGDYSEWINTWGPSKANAMDEIRSWEWSKAWGQGATGWRSFLPDYYNKFNN